VTQFVDAQRHPKECIRRFGRQLKGLSHPNKNGKDRLALARSLSVGTPLVLVPDPSNAYDRNAVLIYRADDPTEDLGYLDATGAKEICRMIECGATFDADVYWIDKHEPDFPKIYMWVYQLTPMTLKRRPARHDAPVYSESTRPNRAFSSAPAPAVPSFGQDADDSESSGGPIRLLIRLLKSFLP
jgi:hypothetical protein